MMEFNIKERENNDGTPSVTACEMNKGNSHEMSGHYPGSKQLCF
jgi:hypothetical protein